MHRQWLDRDNFSTFLCFYIIFVHEKYLLVHPRMVDFSGKVQFITFDQSHPLKGCRSQKSLSDNKRPMKSLKIMIMDKKTHPKLYKVKLCKQSAIFSIIVYFLSCKIYAWLYYEIIIHKNSPCFTSISFCAQNLRTLSPHIPMSI